MKLKNRVWYLIGDTLKWIWPFRLMAIWKPGIAVSDRSRSLCVEGYPRSGNTFLFALCSQLIPKERIAHHLHNCAQLRSAIDNNVPVLFVTRPPLEAISSYIIREDIPVKRAFAQYYTLYSFVEMNKDRISIIPFEKLIHSTDDVVREIIRTLKIDASSTIDREKLKNDIDAMDMADQGSKVVNPLKVGLPTEERTKLKKQVSDKLRTEYPEMLNQCERVYEKVVG